MQLLDHVSISVPNLDLVRPFYDAVMAALGAAKAYDNEAAIGYGERCHRMEVANSYISIYQSAEANCDARRHWCFKAATRDQVKAFYAAGLRAGGLDDGPPGLRLQYHEDYFAAFLRDPVGNRIEAVCHSAER